MELSRAVIQSIHLGEFDIRRLREYEIDTATELDYITEPITYERFFIEYLLPNKACVFGTWATEGWTSRQEWVTKENKPNIQFLKKEFGAYIIIWLHIGFNLNNKNKPSISE